jgi:beta-xylosidase
MTKALAALLTPLLASAAPAQAPLHVPVLRENFPDPFVVEHDGEYIGYATNQGLNLPMVISRDLVSWQPVTGPDGKRKDGMPVLASWVESGRTWAPEILRIGDRWLLYYTARDRRKNMQCVGVAIADDPKGPYRDESSEPLVCQTELGGTIDAHPFRDSDNRLYLYYKNDGNGLNPPKPTAIYAQRLSPDGRKLIGEAVPLVTNDVHWEWRVVEAPTMVRTPTGYTLVFSGNHFGWEDDQRLSNYATGYARCDGPMGPCRDAPENPILLAYNDTRGCLSGPGHPAVFGAKGRTYIAFHGYDYVAGCNRGKRERYMYIAPMGLSPDGKPLIGPSLRPDEGRAR